MGYGLLRFMHQILQKDSESFGFVSAPRFNLDFLYHKKVFVPFSELALFRVSYVVIPTRLIKMFYPHIASLSQFNW